MRPTFDLRAGKVAEDDYNGQIDCKRPAGTSVAIEEMDWSSMTEDYICFTEDFNADAELSESCDDASGISSSNDKDSDDNSLALILGVVGAVLVVGIVVFAYFWKKQKSAKPPASSGASPPSLGPIKATAVEEMPPSTALAEESPAAEGWAAETMAEEAPQPPDGWAARSLQLFASWRPSPRQPEGSLEGAAGGSAETMAEEEAPQQSWRGETMAAEPPPPPAAEAYAPEAELEPEC